MFVLFTDGGSPLKISNVVSLAGHDSSATPTQPPGAQVASNTTGNVGAVQQVPVAQTDKHVEARPPSVQLPPSQVIPTEMSSEQQFMEKTIHECKHCGMSCFFHFNMCS